MVMSLLYFGKPVLVPVALSVLLAFILTPLVHILERWRLGRTPAVLVATGFAFATIGLALWALAAQTSSLAADLPNHKNEIKAKLASLQVDEGSTFSRLNDMFDELFPSDAAVVVTPADPDQASGDSTDEPPGAVDAFPDFMGPAVVADQPPPAPTSIIVAAPTGSTFSSAIEILLPIVEPLATAALVVVLVMFLLLRREDVRYRMISLMGDAALTGTTRLMRDTAERVSKYLLNLLLVNAAFGLWFGLGLYLLDVPYAALWGFLTLVLRFIPFLGSPASVLFPLLVSIATSSGWSQPIWVVVFFTVSELVTANVIEPVLFGKTTGLTPIALLIAALFWAWLWGPIGLLLSTPLTVCLVVMGQHLPHLRSLKVLLAEQPVLDARLQFFQRLLAGDAGEGSRVFNQYVASFGDARAFDEVLVPALSWTRLERGKESITADEERFIWTSTRNVLRDLDTLTLDGSSQTKTEQAEESLPQHDFDDAPRPRIYGYPVHHESEEIGLAMLEHLIEDRCEVRLCTTKQLPTRALEQIEAWAPDAVVLAVLPPGGLPQVKYMCGEIHARCPDTHIIVAYLGTVKDYDDLLVKVREVGASYLTTSLAQTSHQIDMLIEDYVPQ